MNDDSRRTYSTNSQIKFKTAMLKLSLCDYSDSYIIFKRTIAAPKTAAATTPTKNGDKKVAFNNFALTSDCISEINNTQVDDSRDIDILVPMNNLI